MVTVMDSWHTLGKVVITIVVLVFCFISSILTTLGISFAGALAGASTDNQKAIFPVVCLGYGVCLWIIIDSNSRDITNLYGWLFSIILLIGCVLIKLLEIKGLANILIFLGMSVFFSLIINILVFIFIS